MEALIGVGDPVLGQWEERGANGVYHVRRRLSEAEQKEFGILAVRDVRGTEEEARRLAAVYAAVPAIRGLRL